MTTIEGARRLHREHPTVSLVVVRRDAASGDQTEQAVIEARLGPGWQCVVVDAAENLSSGLSAGLARASGQFVVYVSPAQVPVRAMAERVLHELRARPDVDVVYFDEAADADDPAFVKPLNSPERLRSQNYWGSFVAYSAGLLRTILKRPLQFDGAEIYALALRASRQASSVHRSPLQVPRISPTLEHLWCDDSAVRRQGVRSALDEHLAETGGGLVDRVDDAGVHQTRRIVKGDPLVSIIIPTRGSPRAGHTRRRAMVLDAIQGVKNKTTYTNVEFIVVADDSTPSPVLEELRSMVGERFTLVPWSRPFSFSEKMNLGVVRSRGEYLLFLNDDVELISPDWIQAMLSLAQLPRAGTVGAMLYFDDDTIQHAGHAYSWRDVTHVGLHSDRGAKGPSSAFLVEREVDGNTAACMMVKRDCFIEAGGFSPLLPGNFNDVDLCMKLNSLGYVSYWTPRAEFYHFESATRDPRVSQYEVDLTWGRWGHEFGRCGFWLTDPHVRHRKGN